MILPIIITILKLFKKWEFYFLIFISAISTIFISDNSWSFEGLKFIPSTIGVILGGLLTTIAIIFSIIKEEELKSLYEKYGEKFFNSLNKLKNHIYLILISLLFSILTFLFDAPAFLLKLLEKISLSVIVFFYFFQVFFLFLTIYSAIEVVNTLFLVFEIKYTLIKKNTQNKKE